jgi:putative salt-induced outer membrane protein YdiY
LGLENGGRTLKRDLPKSQNVFVRVVWLCVIMSCFLVVNIKVHAAQRIYRSVETEVESSGIQYVLADAGETDTPTTTETENKMVPNQAWVPPPPPPDDFDWIQLTSGEWLKGELKVLYAKKLEFDSDKLGLLEFKWKDVRQVRGHQIFSVRFEGPVTVVGLLQVTENKVFLAVGKERQEFERNQLIAIAPGEPKEINYWSAKISLGLNVSQGNTDQVQYNSKWNIKRRTSATRLVFDYLGNFSSTEGVETINNQRLNSFFDVFKTRKFFYRPIFGEYYRDLFKNIKSRVTLGAGIGYHIIDTPKTKWDMAGGPAYQKTQFDSVQPGQDSSESTPALVAGTHFETDLTKAIDFEGGYSFQILNEASGTYTHHLIATLESELTRWVDFDISFIWDRTQDPQPEADGRVPDQDDFYLIFSVGVDF